MATTGSPPTDPIVARDSLSSVARRPLRLTPLTVAALKAVAEHPGASNRAVARLVGVGDDGQASRLLARLLSAGVLENRTPPCAPGSPNAWWLTAAGARLLSSLPS